MIIIKFIILYFIQIRHTDDFPSTGIPASSTQSLCIAYRNIVDVILASITYGNDVRGNTWLRSVGVTHDETSIAAGQVNAVGL